jgi:hypothetical protein
MAYEGGRTAPRGETIAPCLPDTLGAASTTFLAQCGQRWVYKLCTAAAIRSAMQQMLHAVEESL